MILKGGTNVTLFGPRGTGKTTLLGQLRSELGLEQEPDAPPWEMVVVDLRRAISIPAFIAAVAEALADHPSNDVRRRAKAAFGRVEKEIGINLGIVKARVRTEGSQAEAAPVLLHKQLAALTDVADRVVIAFDEFQRLASCPGEPLSVIRSALLGPGTTGRVSLLLTGSLRERLDLMLHSSHEPIWDQTHDIELPELDRTALIEYLEFRFEATQKPIDDRAAEDLVQLTDAHPKRSQHLAWYVWECAKPKSTIQRVDVYSAFDELLNSDRHTTDFEGIVDNLLGGDESDINDSRALFLLAAGARTGSNNDAQRYGLSSASATQRALERLKTRGLVTRNQEWKIVDPLLAEWLRRRDPLGS